jgi:tRNA(adenine34) deaminase
VRPVDDQDAMAEALAEARAAGAAGEVPVGAVVVVDGRLVARAGNQRERRQDPTAHAEVLALAEAARVLGSWRLTGATLVVTLEPCPMCAGALIASRTARVVYGTSNPDAGACGSLYNLCVDPRLNHEVEVVHGVRAQECAALLEVFFAERRPT